MNGTSYRNLALAAALAALTGGCGDNLGLPDAAAPPPPDAAPADAMTVCGDGIVSGDELCDTDIATGTGACPTECTPSADPCITVTLLGEGTCFAECSETTKTDFIDADGCCPAGGNEIFDDDCDPVCGNGVVETGEDCDDGGTAPGDGCDAVCACEAGVCGDGDVNCGEQCDDGGTVPGDGCDAACQREAVAFRIADLYIRDPHFFALIADVLCTDITDMPLDQCGVNCQLNDSISMDADGDGYLDLNIMAVFRPLIQDVPMTRADFLVGECTVAKDCAPQFGGAVDTRVMFNTPAGGPNCLDPVAAHLHAPPYDPPVLSTPAHCVVSADAPLTLSFAGITLVFATAEIAATYNADPATNLMTGLIKGFITEADADSLVLPISLPFVGGKPLSEILVGGTNNCKCDHGTTPASCQSDGPPMEVGPDGTTPGWWFYMNFTAEAVNWDENPVLPDAGP